MCVCVCGWVGLGRGNGGHVSEDTPGPMDVQ